jgi:hypothetical protein
MPANRRRSGLVVALIAAIIVIAALLVTALTLPLLSRSIPAFAAVAGASWLAIFGATFALSRSLGGLSARADFSAGSEAFAQSPERIPNHTLADQRRLLGVASSPTDAEKRLD